MAELFNPGNDWNPETTFGGWVHQSQRAQFGSHATYSASKLIVALDGGCRDNGKPSAKAAIGVFFGPKNSHNRAEMLVDDPDITWTSQRAELWAASRAARLVTGLVMKKCKHSGKCKPALHQQLDTVIFKSDSEYVVKGITSWYMKWQSHDWKNALGNPVVNKDLWDRLYRQVTRLQRFGVTVCFWHVERLQNSEADLLANHALINKIPAVYPYPKTRKRKREDGDDAAAAERVLVDTSTTSDPVWRHHHELAHLDLDIFKRTLRFYNFTTVITEADVQAKIDSKERCRSCHERGAKDLKEIGNEQDERPAAKRARVEPDASYLQLLSVIDAPMLEVSSSGLDFAKDFQFKFERPSGVVF